MNDAESDFLPCGIEVSAQGLVVALGTRPRRDFPNTPSGRQAVLRFLDQAGGRVRVCPEATGRYGLDLALALHTARLLVIVANPRAVRHFAHALMKRSKNDPIDVQVLVEFAQRMPFQCWQRPAPAALHLQALARRLEALGDMHAAEKNRLHAAQLSEAWPEDVRRDLRRSLRAFYLHLLERGKTKMQALVAVPAERDRLLHAIFGMFKHQQPFDGARLYRLAEDSPLPQPSFSTVEAA